MRTKYAKSLFYMLPLLGILLAPGCKDNSTDPVYTTPPPPTGGGSGVSFSSNVLPILSGHGCTGCHGGTNGLTVGTVASLLAGGNHGPAVIAGHADSSLIVAKISPTPPFGSRMPLGGPYLSTAEIQTIKDWINQGAKNN
jgi:hypothetical protein